MAARQGRWESKKRRIAWWYIQRCTRKGRIDAGIPIGRWALALKERVHANVAAVALANKQARTAWALLMQGTVYLARPAA